MFIIILRTGTYTIWPADAVALSTATGSTWEAKEAETGDAIPADAIWIADTLTGANTAVLSLINNGTGFPTGAAQLLWAD